MKQRGIVRLEGTYDDVTFYNRSGQSLARKKGGISKDRMMVDPAFERQRANFSEFSGSAIIAKAIRQALLMNSRKFNDVHGNRQLTGLIRQIIKNGAGLRGERAFELVANSHLLKGFNFKNKDPLTDILLAPVSVTSVAARNEATLTVPDFNTIASLSKPVGATHFRLILSIGAISDYHYVKGLGYQPVNPLENKLQDRAVSALIPINGMMGAPVSITATLAGSPTISANTALIAAVGVEFIEQDGAQDYLLHDNKCLKVIEVF